MDISDFDFRDAFKEGALLTAITDCDLNAIKSLLEKGANVNHVDCMEEQTPLGRVITPFGYMWLYYTHRLRQIPEASLENEATVNAVGITDMTPLHINFAKKRKVIELLIEHGADINASDASGCTLLCHIIGRIRAEISSSINEHNAMYKGEAHLYSRDIDIITRDRIRKFFDMLIGYGADVNARGRNGHTPLSFTIESIMNDESDSPRLLDVLEVLLENDADVNAQDEEGNTPFHIALSHCRPRIIKMLIEHGADVNFLNNEENTPLHEAVGRLNPQLVKMLIEHGADVNAVGIDNRTPLHEAAKQEDSRLIEMLIEHGADVNATDRFRRIPLHMFRFDINLDSIYAIETLLKEGSDVNIRDERGLTPIGHLLPLVARYPLDSDDVAKILIFHMIKLKVAGLYLNEDNLGYLRELQDRENAPESKLHEQECEKEVERLKSTRVDTNLSLHDILTSNNPRYTQNETAVQKMILNYNEIPHYRKLLEHKYERDKARVTLLEESKKSLIKILNGGDTKIKPVFLPYELLDRILCHFSNLDLEDLMFLY